MALRKTNTMAGFLWSIGAWIAGFVLTGNAFHDLTTTDIRRFDASAVLLHLCYCGLLCGAFVWFVFVVPTDLATLLVSVPLALVGLKASLFVVQWFGVIYLETNQYLGTRYDTTVHECVFQGVRNGLDAGNRDGPKRSR